MRPNPAIACTIGGLALDGQRVRRSRSWADGAIRGEHVVVDVAAQSNDGAVALELRPICEHCAVDLPPSAANAMICSFECTFCSECVQVLQDVCPNCGGGFQPRPIRPMTNWKGGNDLTNHPASMAQRHRPVDIDAHRAFAQLIATIPPGNR